MTISTRQLSIPDTVNIDPKATEIARVWVAGGRQHVTLATDVWDDPAAWGIFLVDLAKHVANAYKETQGREPSATLDRIKEGFDAEWGSPTDTPTGRVID